MLINNIIMSIKAIKNGKERVFTKAIWDMMPEDKYGYKIVIIEDIPEEVIVAMNMGGEMSEDVKKEKRPYTKKNK